MQSNIPEASPSPVLPSPISPLNPYVQALQQAGFVVTSGHVRIENFAIDYLTRSNGQMSIQEPLPREVLFPWKNAAVPQKISLLHFSLHECEPCHVEIVDLHAFIAKGAVPHNVQLLQFAFGTDATAIIADEMLPLVPEGAKIYLDPEDGLADRLGATSAPASFVLDEEGVVVGVNNDSTQFDSPGMDILMARLAQWPSVKAKHPELTSLHKAVLSPGLRLPDSPTAEWLKSIPVHGALLLVVAIGLLPLTVKIGKRTFVFLGKVLAKKAKK
jgi:hypothetical protein